MLGENRLITGPEAGITRDSISVDWIWTDPSPKEREPDEEGNVPPMLVERRVRLIDTAGMRKRAKVQDKLEKLSVADARHAIDFAEVVVLLLDATKGLEVQDLKIADHVIQEGRALIIGISGLPAFKLQWRHAVKTLAPIRQTGLRAAAVRHGLVSGQGAGERTARWQLARHFGLQCVVDGHPLLGHHGQ